MGKARAGILVCFFLGLGSCAAQQSGADFYEGLKKRQVSSVNNAATSTSAAGAHSQSVSAAAASATASAVAHFEKALNDVNPVITAAAAAELMSMHFAGLEFSDAKMISIRQKAVGKAAGSWARAFEALETVPPTEAREKIFALLMDGDSRFLGEVERYVLQRLRNGEAEADAEAADSAVVADSTAAPPAVATHGIFTPAENAAIDGRFAVSRSRYNEALIFFRIVLSDSPELFFRYPDLLTDLGRTFQYAATGREGIELFLNWEKMVGNGAGLPPAGTAAVLKTALWEFITADNENLVRFRLLFFAARIAKQRGDLTAAIELFEKALPLARAVSPEQTDACIWYILDSSLALGSGRTIRYLETYIPQWHDDAYFSDVLDKLTRELISKRQWKDILHLYTLLKGRPAAAKQAWIISRAIEEKLYAPGEFAAVYMRLAYDAGKDASRNAHIGNSAWYYHSLSASSLNQPFWELTEMPPEQASPETEPEAPLSDTMQFLLGFFKHDAALFAPRYIKAEESNLSPEELRQLAKALNGAGQYQESMRVVALYARQNGYPITRQDLELLYPRPFKELVEKYAEEAGLEPALLFGLIRTESAFNSNVVSRAGAIGLSQLMPATAQEAAARIVRRGGPNYAVEGAALDLSNPAVNIHIGASYLAFLNERMEDPLLALMSYNGGMNRVRRWWRSAARGNLPADLFMETVEYAETRNYGRNVLGAAAVYRNLY